jgi:hypothetical protein
MWAPLFVAVMILAVLVPNEDLKLVQSRKIDGPQTRTVACVGSVGSKRQQKKERFRIPFLNYSTTDCYT